MPRRRRNDPRNEVDPDEVERFFTSLPRVIRGLRRGRIQNLTIAVFVLISTLIYFHVTETQQHQIRAAAARDRQSSFRQCQVANDNARSLNKFLDVAIAATRSAPNLTSSERKYRVSLYESIKQTLPVCEKPKEKP